MKRFATLFLLTFLLLFTGVCYYFSTLVIVPRKKIVPSPTELAKLYNEPELVQFRTEDGLVLKGWYFDYKEPNDRGVVLAHGHGSTRFGMRHWMSFFWERKADILMYDHRAHGESEGTYGTFGIKESEDLKLVHDWFKSESDLKDSEIGWVGSSWGAATVLHAASNQDSLWFVLADSPFRDLDAAVIERAVRDYGEWVELIKPIIYSLVEIRADFDPYSTSTLEAAKSISVPTLLIHSQADEATSSDQSVAIAEAMNDSILVFHHTDWGSFHTKDVQNFPDRYGVLISEFLSRFDREIAE